MSGILPPGRLAPAKLEINVKINALPTNIETVKNDWKMFNVEADGRIFRVKVRPRIWRKIEEADQEFPMWVASITGKLGPPIKGGFELLEPAVQVFEKKPKPPKEESQESEEEPKQAASEQQAMDEE